ncbi:MAG TPA: AtpZ/AtpI family protein [Candidatus Saccharimonadales bacterium]|nr:AtpZ/AtpI family protein [Candidatus Saccharimonadales bacterium]
MKKAAAHPTQPTPHDPFTLGSLGIQFLDTTWRIAVPVVLFAVGGIFADRHFGSKPWLTLLGMVAGFVVAGFLLKMQIAAVNKENK